MGSALSPAEGPGGEAPWRPGVLRVYGIYRRERDVLVRRADGTRSPRKKVSHDLRFRVDDRSYRIGFAQKGWAESYAQQLHAGFAQARLFDPRARRFLTPEEEAPPAEEPAPSFFAHAREYVLGQWHRWAPGTRPDVQREIARACVYLLRAEAPALDDKERVVADRYLRRRCLILPQPDDLTDADHRWQHWFETWSMPIDAVTDEDLRRFLQTVRSVRIDGTPRQLGKGSVNRTRMVVRRVFSHAHRRRLIDWDPWEAIDAEPVPDQEQVDPDLVMDPEQVLDVAHACGARHPRYEAFVLVQGLCGLRQGEATDLRRRDLALDLDEPLIVVRGSHSAVPARFFTPDETPRRPLKGRGPRASRKIPVPDLLVPKLRTHLDQWVGGRGDDLAFTNTGGGRIIRSNFGRDVWIPVRNALFADDDPLRKVRRQDLRHSAITAWLNAGVPLKTAQAWSGHKTASVLLNTYLGVLRGDEELARERWNNALPRPRPNR